MFDGQPDFCHELAALRLSESVQDPRYADAGGEDLCFCRPREGSYRECRAENAG
jgi:hypothetical protein